MIMLDAIARLEGRGGGGGGGGTIVPEAPVFYLTLEASTRQTLLAGRGELRV